MKKYFRPLEDITAYETAVVLARAAGGLGGSMWHRGIDFTQQQWEELPVSLKRHFQDDKSGGQGSSV